MPRFSIPAALALTLAALPALAQSAPPAGAMPLSQVIAQVEALPDFRHVDEVDWDDDGYWDVEYVNTEGRSVDLRLDPMTGAVRR